MKLLYTNCSVQQTNFDAFNQINGCVVYESNTSPDSYLYIQLNEYLLPVVDSVEGYSLLYATFPNDKVFHRTESKLDLSAYGYGSLTVDEILSHPDIGVKIFCEVIRDENETIIGIKNLLIYSVEPTGDCYNKTVKFLKSYITFNGQPVTFNGEYVTSYNL